MRFTLFAAMLLVACGPLTGCSRDLEKTEVREFIDKADAAARKRFAPEICAMRGEDFKLRVKFQGHDWSVAPTELEMSRKLFCKEAGTFSQLRQYRLERESIDIALAADRKTARVWAKYVETMPYYEPDMMPRTPDDFSYFQIVKSRDESVVGFEGGELVFLNTWVESTQILVPKNKIDLPYD